MTPALGLAWAHCINTRILLERSSSYVYTAAPSPSPTTATVTATLLCNNENDASYINTIHNKPHTTSNTKQSLLSPDRPLQQQVPVPVSLVSTSSKSKSRRRLTVVFSPIQPVLSCPYEITASGVYCIYEYNR